MDFARMGVRGYFAYERACVKHDPQPGRISREDAKSQSKNRRQPIGSVLVLTLRVFATWRLCVKVFFCTRDLTQRRKAAKKNRKVRHYLRFQKLALYLLFC